MKKLCVRILCALGMLAVSTLCITSCKKDNPGEEETGNALTIRKLLEDKDMAAIVTWDYDLDAAIDHALLTSPTAQYSRSNLVFSVNSKSEKRVMHMKEAQTVQVTVHTVLNRLTSAPEDPAGITIEILPTADRVVADVKGLKWDREYCFTVEYDSYVMEGVLVTVDRRRESATIEVELPSWNIKLNDTHSGYNKSTDTYTGAKLDLTEAVYNALVANHIINTDPQHPDFENLAAFQAKEGKFQPATQEGDNAQFAFSNGSVSPQITPSSKLKQVLENGGRLVGHVATYSGQLVKITLPVTVEYPVYDFLHLSYYTFNSKTSASDNFIHKYDFDGNDGSVLWWTQVNPAYYTTRGSDPHRISNRHALAQYNVSPINLAELAFCVVDAQDKILTDTEIAAANLSVRFSYTDRDLGGQPLPTPAVTAKYKTYADLWSDASLLYYRNVEKRFIPIRGTISIQSGDTEFELPTRFDHPRASVQYPAVTLDYSSYAVTGWLPFKTPENPGVEVILDEHKIYRIPLLRELKDNRPQRVSYYVIRNGAWEVGNVPASAANDATSSSGNGYVNGITAREAYGIDSSTGLKFELGTFPADMKRFVSVQQYNGFPHLVIDYSSQFSFHGTVTVPVTCTLTSPWQTLRFTYAITIKGY